MARPTTNRIVDLNTAPKKELADLPMVGPKRARDLMQHRPFKSWDKGQNVPGFDRCMIGDLKSGGAQIGSSGKAALNGQ
jgi:DNA uptake protein ComE-like DNA-binding protein